MVGMWGERVRTRFFNFHAKNETIDEFRYGNCLLFEASGSSLVNSLNDWDSRDK